MRVGAIFEEFVENVERLIGGYGGSLSSWLDRAETYREKFEKKFEEIMNDNRNDVSYEDIDMCMEYLGWSLQGYSMVLGELMKKEDISSEMKAEAGRLRSVARFIVDLHNVVKYFFYMKDVSGGEINSLRSLGDLYNAYVRLKLSAVGMVEKVR